jgi:hypothetical protein
VRGRPERSWRKGAGACTCGLRLLAVSVRRAMYWLRADCTHTALEGRLASAPVLSDQATATETEQEQHPFSSPPGLLAHHPLLPAEEV